jgi:hypothetical protein
MLTSGVREWPHSRPGKAYAFESLIIKNKTTSFIEEIEEEGVME